MKRRIFFKIFFAIIIIFAINIFLACEKKIEQKEEVKSESISEDTTSVVSEPVVEEPITIPDLKGKWTGVFDSRSTTLNIAEQTDSSFSGKISINYRQVINQEVKGSFSPTTLKMNMNDQLHSRYEGSYSGKLSKDFSTYSGTFTMKVDGKKFSFNLKKQ